MGIKEGEGGSDKVPNAGQVLIDVAVMATDIEEEEEAAKVTGSQGQIKEK